VGTIVDVLRVTVHLGVPVFADQIANVASASRVEIATVDRTAIAQSQGLQLVGVVVKRAKRAAVGPHVPVRTANVKSLLLDAVVVNEALEKETAFLYSCP